MKNWKKIVLIVVSVLAIGIVVFEILSYMVAMEHEGMGPSREDLKKERLLIERGLTEQKKDTELHQKNNGGQR